MASDGTADSVNGDRPRSSPPPLSVSVAAAHLQEQVKTAFGGRRVRIRGVLEGLSGQKSKGGHRFFSLVEYRDVDGSREPVARVDAVMWREARKRMNRQLRDAGLLGAVADGATVTVMGRFQFYVPTGKVSFHADGIDTESLKQAAVQERDRVVGNLHREGLTGRNSRLSVPAMPLRVAVVTSRGSAAHHDVERVLQGSGFAVRLACHSARVQGGSAVAEIVAALSDAARSDADVVLLCRGGGSGMDLRAFDDPEVARAVALSAKPVFAGVGHDTDSPVVDSVAHTAFSTPTAAAEGVASMLRRCAHDIDAERRSLDSAVAALLTGLRRELGDASAGLAAGLTARSAAERKSLAVLSDEIDEAVSGRLNSAREALTGLRRVFAAADPAARLQQGWSLTRRADGTLLRSWRDVGEGTLVTTLLADGLLTSAVRSAAPAVEQQTGGDVSTASPVSR